MKNSLLSILFIALFSGLHSQSHLISIMYDFDGMDIGQSSMPDGGFGNGDLHYSAVPNPLGASDVLGDRVVNLHFNWQSGYGEFGKACKRFVELNANTDYLNFYFYNPATSSGVASVTAIILEDDNGNDVYEGGSDDKWVKQISINQSGGWQLISIPLSTMTDGNAGGNGVFDAAYTNTAGMLFSVSFSFTHPSSAQSDDYYMDMICFSNGSMPTGASNLDLPKGEGYGKCSLGILTANSSPDGMPGDVEPLLPPGKKFTFVNWFVYYSDNSTTPDEYTGNEVQNLINNGYQPIITWEMMFKGYSRLDPVQPRLASILNGSFDGYIDAFAAKIKSYSGTVILRIFHEFEGDWYPWSLTENGLDPAKYKSAFRHVVERFRSVGANNVKWMWCLNAEPKPYKAYNWVVSAYPGDDVVDIVATDIYNHPDPGTPAWKSFRYTLAESYYLLTKYYGHKPLYICEVASRERNSGEDQSSQTKGDWICQMSKDLQSYFSKVEALVFFSMTKEHDWRINSSSAAQSAFVNCIWNSSSFGPLGVEQADNAFSFTAYPNPFNTMINIRSEGTGTSGDPLTVRLFDLTGSKVFEKTGIHDSDRIDLGDRLGSGVYILELQNGSISKKQKLIKVSPH